MNDDKVAQLLDLLHADFATVMQNAFNIALHQSLQSAALVKQVESYGYRVTAQLDYTLLATPVEAILDQTLSEEDLRFLAGIKISVGAGSHH